MSQFSRRDFLKSGMAGMGAVSFGLMALSQSGCNRRIDPVETPFGILRPVPDEVSGLPLLLLPEGFRYKTISWAGESLSDGYLCPRAFDGMGVVAENDSEIRLIRNHELRDSVGANGPPQKAYDITEGGTSTLVFDKASESVRESWISLVGTMNNCAGGVTPWGTWLSCEEAPFVPGREPSSRQSHWHHQDATRPHGYVFEVPADGVAEPVPLTAMGQFEHEAATVDPDSGIVYMTEDTDPNAGLYRFVPETKGQLAQGGRLEMLAVNGGQDMKSGLPHHQQWDTAWVDIEDPTRGFDEGEREGFGVVNQGLKNGGSAFIALEGAIWNDGKLYFTSKRGGGAGAGYIFEYSPTDEKISVLYESPGHSELSGPDNIDVSPRGNLVICEDRVSSDKLSQCLAGITKSGAFHKFCVINPDLSGMFNGFDLANTARKSEWAGVCFSADGRWMFANLQEPGITVAITGPWENEWM